MKFNELLKIVNSVDSDKYHDADVLVDTDAAEFAVHLVEVAAAGTDSVYDEVYDRPIFMIHLDNDVKIHRTYQERRDD